MGNYRLPKIMPGELKNAGQDESGGKEKAWTDCVAEDRRVSRIMGDWRTAAQDRPWGVIQHCNTVYKGGCRLWSRW